MLNNLDMLGLNLERIDKRSSHFLLPLNDTLGNVFFLWIIASYFYIVSLEIWLNVICGILILKGLENLCWLSFQNLDFMLYWLGLAKLYVSLAIHIIGKVSILFNALLITMSRTLGIQIIYHVVIITISEVFHRSSL